MSVCVCEYEERGRSEKQRETLGVDGGRGESQLCEGRTVRLQGGPCMGAAPVLSVSPARCRLSCLLHTLNFAVANLPICFGITEYCVLLTAFLRSKLQSKILTVLLRA